MHLGKLRLIVEGLPGHAPVLSIFRLRRNINPLVWMNHSHKFRTFHFNIRVRNLWFNLCEQIKGNVDNAHCGQNRVSRKVAFKGGQVLVNNDIRHDFGCGFFRNIKIYECGDSLVHHTCFANSGVLGQGRL